MKTTIEINGRIYDAQSGKILANTHTATQKQQSTKESQTSVESRSPTKNLKLQRGVVMDGVRRKPATQLSQKPTQPAHQSTQRSQTLHRKAVKKPIAPKSVPYVHSTSANTTSKVEQSATGRGMLLKRVPDAKLHRALQAKKSTLVSRFSKNTQPVHPSPIAPTSHASPQKNASATSETTKITPSAPPTAPALHAPNRANGTAQQQTKETKKFVFEDQIKKANNHLLKPVKKESKRKRILRSMKLSPKIVSGVAAVFAVLLLGGFLAYQNVPSVSMRVAANKAGFDASLPSNIPAGYSFNGPVKVNDQVVSLEYGSNSDDRRFIITQRPTNWSSEALLTNYLLDSQYRYQAYKDKGVTIYIYDGSNATWVDKGIWYSVNGQDGSLSSEQLLELASSI